MEENAPESNVMTEEPIVQAPEMPEMDEKNTKAQNMEAMRLQIKALKEELNQVKNNTASEKESTESIPEPFDDEFVKYGDVKKITSEMKRLQAAVTLYGNYTDYSKVVTDENIEEFKRAEPATYSAVYTSLDPVLIGAGLYESIKRRQALRGIKQQTEKRIQQNTKGINLSPENQLSSAPVKKANGKATKEYQKSLEQFRKDILAGKVPAPL